MGNRARIRSRRYNEVAQDPPPLHYAAPMPITEDPRISDARYQYVDLAHREDTFETANNLVLDAERLRLERYG